MFGLLVVFITATCAASGAVLVAHGLRRSKAAGIEGRGVVRKNSDGRPAVGFVQVVAGMALVVPAVWLLASVLAVVVDS